MVEREGPAGDGASGAPVPPAPRWEAVGLTGEEYAAVCRLLRREPNDVELGLFGAMWSEHCAYKSSRAHLGRFPTEAPQVLIGPGENAGVLDLGGGHAVALRMESHNHPSAVEPFEGAATGVGGILRDIFTMGARPVALLDGLRFGDPAEARSARLAAGVVAGIAHYGNCVGVPTVGGEATFDPAYRDNPLVNVMCVGFLERRHLQHGAAPGPGNAVLLVGNRTGRDGIHGASLLASRTFSAAPAEMRPAVQVGDPFVGKLLIEACLELAAAGLLRGMNDLGAAGVTSAASETAGRAGTGIRLDLDAVPCREAGMNAYEILLSESQERMLLVVAPEDVPAVVAVCTRYGLEAARIGSVTADRRLRVRLRGQTVADVPVRALTRRAPRYRRPALRPEPARRWLPPTPPDPPEALAAWLLELLAQPTIGSKRWIYEQYDHQVQTNTVVPPGAGDAAVLRHRPTGSGIALALDMGGAACALDPYAGGALLVAEGARNVACAGARPWGLTNCLNFASPEDPRVMGAFVRTIDGMAAACRRLGIPVTGGNVSFYNETAGRGIPPTPAVGTLGIMADPARARRAGFPRAGLTIALLGASARVRLDGSAFQRRRWGVVAGAPLRPHWPTESALVELLVAVDYVSSAHDCAEGGLAVALAEAALLAPVGVGARVALPWPPRLRLDALLFGEGPGRVVVSVPAERFGDLAAACARRGLPCLRLGETTDDGSLTLRVGSALLCALPLAEVRTGWEEALPRWLR
jgi:phosphoribosylformylglycinamidine synthase